MWQEKHHKICFLKKTKEPTSFVIYGNWQPCGLSFFLIYLWIDLKQNRKGMLNQIIKRGRVSIINKSLSHILIK